LKHNLILTIFAILSIVACRSNPNKAEKIETKMQQASTVTGSQQVGVKKDEMVVMDKVQMSEKMRDLQNEVYGLEDKTYGTRKLGSLGLYGELKSCRRKLASRQYGGTGNMVWTEPLDRVTDKEEDMKMGLDEKQDLVGVKEEYLRDRVARFVGYKQILQKRADEFQSEIEQCKSELATRELDANQPTKVMVQEAPKASIDKTAINSFMCDYVKTGASLQSLMLTSFSKGWLALADFKLDQSLLAPSLKDGKGVAHENGLLFNGWKLAYDRSGITIGEVLKEGGDAHLTAWTYDKKADVTGAAKCLQAQDGAWNP
jgi:hypothetical protein